MLFLIILIGILVGILTGLIVYARWNYGILESLGIPVVDLTLFMGSTPDLHKQVQHFQDIERFKKFGPVFGVYEGRKPIVYICDPEIIRLVLVKDFEFFHNRREIDLGHPLVNEMLDFLPGEKWREVRSGMSQILTTGKIKKMSFSMKESITEFCDSLNQEVESKGNYEPIKVDIRKKFDGLFIDLICRSAFGIKIGASGDPNNTFVNMFKELMGADAEFDWIYTLSMVFPFLTKLAPTLGSDSASKIAATILSVMTARRQSGAQKGDFIDVLNTMMDKLPSAEYKRLEISETTILSQSINFVLAGFDAMCTTMTMLLYYLAKNPEIQNRVFDEIRQFLDDESNLNDEGEMLFDKMGQLTYLHACLNEALRLCPSFIRPERICTKDWEYKDLKITKGLLVMVPAWAVHRNPELYPEPEKYDPERFMPENKAKLNPYGFLTFGQGPRGCVGIKYAMEAMKYSLCYLLKDFTFDLWEDTKIRFKSGVLFLVMYDSIYLGVSRRNF